MSRTRSIPMMAMGLSFMGCTSAEGVWEAVKITEDGEDITEDYVYEDVDGDCTYRYSIRLMLTGGRGAVGFSYSAGGCGDEEETAYGYGTYTEISGGPRNFELLYDDGQPWLSCKIRRRMTCEIPDEDIIYTFRKLRGTWE